jgi:hypothetical protein
MIRRLVLSHHESAFLLDASSANTGEEQMLLVRDGWVRNIVRGGAPGYELMGESNGFLKLDVFFKQLVNELIGSTSTPNMATAGEGMRSPAAWNLLASRENEAKDIRIARFLEQLTNLFGLMQRRICDPDVDDQDAKDFQEKMLEIMSREELDELANKPVASSIEDLTPIQRQSIVLIAQEKKGNPLYNQRQLEVEDLNARMGADFCKRVLLADQDPTEIAEQSRMQNLEVVLLSAGQPVEVSPRDNHLRPPLSSGLTFGYPGMVRPGQVGVLERLEQARRLIVVGSFILNTVAVADVLLVLAIIGVTK